MDRQLLKTVHCKEFIVKFLNNYFYRFYFIFLKSEPFEQFSYSVNHQFVLLPLFDCNFVFCRLFAQISFTLELLKAEKLLQHFKFTYKMHKGNLKDFVKEVSTWRLTKNTMLRKQRKTKWTTEIFKLIKYLKAIFLGRDSRILHRS